MIEAERREGARRFYNNWVGKGREDEDDRSYWLDLMEDIMGVEHAQSIMEFQKKVVGPDGNTKRIDIYIPSTKVLIEQKSLNIALDKPQAGHNGMTPYEQAKMYDNSLPHSEKAKWIILSNFKEIWIYDMDARVPEPVKLDIIDLQTKYSLLDFLVNEEQVKISQEMEVSVKAGELVGLIYDALLKQYIDPTNDKSLRSLNMLCVRLVFCLYAEDAGIFGSRNMFHDYMDQFDVKDMRKALIELFKILDTKPEDRDPYDTSDLSKFPYVNGGLFADENIEIPNFTEEIKKTLLSKASDDFDWSVISPTIFGAVFESTLNPETRRSGGMHYTSIENIHKVIDPLFLDDLKKELNQIKDIQIIKERNKKLLAFQNKLSSIKWLDPACGSGNFLTETYISVRRLENEVINTIKGGQMSFVMSEEFSPIKVSIDQFYGIEINDFAVTVAKTALWIAESQMMKETEDILLMHLEFLPLKTNAYIHEGNSLSVNWADIVLPQDLTYIMGNPPFVGTNYMTDEQRIDMDNIWKDKRGKLDYVTAWYVKSVDYIKSSSNNIQCAFVSTNSICQGEQASSLWKRILHDEGCEITFAVRSFIWNSESTGKAQVHVVIVGFAKKAVKEKILFVGNSKQIASNINGYLLDAPTIIVEEVSKPLADVPAIVRGSQATDDGHYLFTPEEKKEFIEKDPSSEKYFKRFMMGKEFINNIERWCLWMPNISPAELRSSTLLMERVKLVKEFRLNSNNKQTQQAAEIPWRFGQYRQPAKNFIAFAKVSSERRRYVPFGFLTDDIIPGDKLFTIPDATLYHFGIITSNVHMAWMRTVCGRMKSDYSYSTTIVYNTFPWPTPTEEQKRNIEMTAQAILDARALYPDSTLADLYDPLTMPPELSKAHQKNDIAVMKAYGFDIKNTSEADCVAELMKMYLKLTE